MSDEEVLENYQRVGLSTVDSLNFWQREIFYRQIKQMYRDVKQQSKIMNRLTWAIFFLTFVNVLLFIFSLI